MQGHEVDEDPVDAVTEAPRGPPLLVLLELPDLRSQLRRDGPALLHAERPERALALVRVALHREGLGVLAGELEHRGGRAHGVADRADAERELQGAAAALARLGVGGEPVRLADVALRRAGRARGRGRVDPVASLDQRGHVLDGRDAQPDAAHTGADGRDQVGLAVRAQDPDGALRRLLERLPQEVRRALGHPVGVLDDHDAVAADRRRVLRRRDERAHLVDGDDDPLGREHAEVGVAAGGDLARGRRVALRRAVAEQRGREGVGEVGAPGSGGTRDEPRVRERGAGGVTCRGPRAARRGEERDRLGLAGELVPDRPPVGARG